MKRSFNDDVTNKTIIDVGFANKRDKKDQLKLITIT